MECWGAQGGNPTTAASNTYSGTRGGYGGYVFGVLDDLKGYDKFYIYVGQQHPAAWDNSNNSSVAQVAWNGGGATTGASCGGGATDIRLSTGNQAATVWNNSTSLASRIMVAGAGGGWDCSDGGNAGGLEGYQGSSRSGTPGYGGKRWEGGSGYVAGGFGYGGGQATHDSGGGGSGWYGGGKSSSSQAAGGGGSSYISGHAGCVAITSASNTSPKGGTTATAASYTVDRATHYSGLVFAPTLMIDGAGKKWTTAVGSNQVMPNPTTASSTYSSGVGHTGNGYARITCKPYD